MSELSPEFIILRLFQRLRQAGFGLGMNEYLAALDAIAGRFGTSGLDALQAMLRRLWCHSRDEQRQFDLIWPEVLQSGPQMIADGDAPAQSPKPTGPLMPAAQEAPPPAETRVPAESPDPDFAPLPALPPPFIPIDGDDLPELHTYHPLSRRSMAYGWRYLRRFVATGVADVVDVSATVEQVARCGFFLAPVYRRRLVNQARVLLLVDQGGAMTPFHRFTRELVETALAAGVFPEGQVQVGYFHNMPTEYVYRDAHLTLPRAAAELLAECDRETSVLIVSDAGAARGFRRMERIRKTTEFLVKLKQYSSLISWLNPMPRDRWQGSSAELVAYLVQMEQMDIDGLGNAIDGVRGLSGVFSGAPGAR
jgi:uncharacterized protein